MDTICGRAPLRIFPSHLLIIDLYLSAWLAAILSSLLPLLCLDIVRNRTLHYLNTFKFEKLQTGRHSREREQSRLQPHTRLPRNPVTHPHRLSLSHTLNHGSVRGVSCGGACNAAAVSSDLDFHPNQPALTCATEK